MRGAYLLGQYEKSMPSSLSLAEKLALSRACGFDYMEISIDESDEKLARLDWGRAERLKLRAESERAGQPILSMCLSGHRRFPLGSPDAANAARALDISRKAVEFASDVGIRIIQLAGYDVYYSESSEETRRIFRENLGVTVTYAASRGILLGFETMETPFMNSCQKAMRYVDAISSPYLQVYPDIGNVRNAVGSAYLNDYAAARGHIVAAHLKETRPETFRDVPFGTGHVDFAGSIAALYRMGVRLFVGEFWYDGSMDAMAYARSAHDFLRDKFAQAGI